MALKSEFLKIYEGDFSNVPYNKTWYISNTIWESTSSSFDRCILSDPKGYETRINAGNSLPQFLAPGTRITYDQYYSGGTASINFTYLEFDAEPLSEPVLTDNYFFSYNYYWLSRGGSVTTSIQKAQSNSPGFNSLSEDTVGVDVVGVDLQENSITAAHITLTDSDESITNKKIDVTAIVGDQEVDIPETKILYMNEDNKVFTSKDELVIHREVSSEGDYIELNDSYSFLTGDIANFNHTLGYYYSGMEYSINNLTSIDLRAVGTSSSNVASVSNGYAYSIDGPSSATNENYSVGDNHISDVTISHYAYTTTSGPSKIIVDSKVVPVKLRVTLKN